MALILSLSKDEGHARRIFEAPETYRTRLVERRLPKR